MKNSVLLPLLTCLAAAFCSCAQESQRETVLASGNAGPGDQNYTYKITDETMQFNWRLDGPVLHMKLTAQTAGWLGAGFNPTRGMKDATFIIGYIKNGAVTITQQHGTDIKKHSKDVDLGGTDDVTNTAGAEKGGQTEIRFTMPLRSTDRLDRPIDPAGDTVLLLSYGKSKELGQQHAYWSRLHVNLSSGAYSVTLRKSMP